MRLHSNKASSNSRKPRLKRLPENFRWLVLNELVDSHKHLVPGEFLEEWGALNASPTIEGYYSLGDRWSLQSMALKMPSLPPETVAVVAQVTSLFRKDPAFCLVSSEDRRSRALQRVKDVDRELTVKDGGGVQQRAKDIILEILGWGPECGEIDESVRHGPGLVLDGDRAETSSYFKYRGYPYLVYHDGMADLRGAIQSDPRWLGSLEDLYRRDRMLPMWSILDQDQFWKDVIQPVQHNRVTVVPKDGRKDRPIAVEPGGSVMIQLALDRAIKRRLLTAGVDLRDQRRNCRLARKGSIDGSVATIDLSDASDTVSRDLVRELLPPAWFELLDRHRARKGLFPDGDYLLYRKMSSMGNGYTFALESLIFYAIAKAVVWVNDGDERLVSAYGDDITCPSAYAEELLMYLRLFGFHPNVDKTFVRGPARESCGSDWWNGYNVRPVFCSSLLGIADLISLRNRLQRWSFIHWGEGLCPSLDTLLLRYYEGELLIGPQSNTCLDRWVHDTKPEWQPRLWSGLRTLVFESREVDGPDLGFRKLMHDLKSCSSDEGGRFKVTIKADNRCKVKGRQEAWSELYVHTPYGELAPCLGG